MTEGFLKPHSKTAFFKAILIVQTVVKCTNLRAWVRKLQPAGHMQNLAPHQNFAKCTTNWENTKHLGPNALT